jgi:hypothetical protein
MRFLVALALIAGCKAKEPKKHEPKPPMAAAELQRGQDACKAYVERVCACAAQKPDLVKQCELSKALPQAIEISLSVATHPDSKKDIVEQSYANIRKTVASCIDETAKLPTLGCN